MKSSTRKKLIKPVPFTKLLPNLVTLIGLIIGVSSIRFAIDNAWEISVYCILIATIVDFVDGRVARMFNATSHFGAELDSLCDFVNFGLCPAITLYLWSFQQYEYKITSWMSIMIFIVCMAIRLARFNTTLVDSKITQDKRFFFGVPAPIGAILALMPIILDFEFTLLIQNFSIRNYTPGINIYIVAVSLMLASRFPTISFKYFHINPEYLSVSMIIFASISIMIIIYPWYTIPAMALIYLLSIPGCMFIAFKTKKSNPSI
jgi:CDP-diacylglycerol---serine O-phosphatidyltransferase